MNLPDISTHDGRRAWAFLAIVGGCIVQTVHLFALTYLLRDSAEHLFYMSIGLIGLLFVGFTALGWQMGRRLQIQGSRDGISLDDGGENVAP